MIVGRQAGVWEHGVKLQMWIKFFRKECSLESYPSSSPRIMAFV